MASNDQSYTDEAVSVQWHGLFQLSKTFGRRVEQLGFMGDGWGEPWLAESQRGASQAGIEKSANDMISRKAHPSEHIARDIKRHRSCRDSVHVTVLLSFPSLLPLLSISLRQKYAKKNVNSLIWQRHLSLSYRSDDWFSLTSGNAILSRG